MLAIGEPIMCDMISESGMRFLYGLALAGFPSFLSASSSTLLATPIVICFLQFGQIFFIARLSCGDRQVPQSLCPS